MAPNNFLSYQTTSSLQGICWETHATAGGDEIATQVFKNNVAKVRYESHLTSFFVVKIAILSFIGWTMLFSV